MQSINTHWTINREWIPCKFIHDFVFFFMSNLFFSVYRNHNMYSCANIFLNYELDKLLQFSLMISLIYLLHIKFIEYFLLFDKSYTPSFIRGSLTYRMSLKKHCFFHKTWTIKNISAIPSDLTNMAGSSQNVESFWCIERGRKRLLGEKPVGQYNI